LLLGVCSTWNRRRTTRLKFHVEHDTSTGRRFHVEHETPTGAGSAWNGMFHVKHGSASKAT